MRPRSTVHIPRTSCSSPAPVIRSPILSHSDPDFVANVTESSYKVFQPSLASLDSADGTSNLAEIGDAGLVQHGAEVQAVAKYAVPELDGVLKEQLVHLLQRSTDLFTTGPIRLFLLGSLQKRREVLRSTRLDGLLPGVLGQERSW